MTICELKKIISNLPEETILLVEVETLDEVKTIDVQYHADGRVQLFLSTWE